MQGTVVVLAGALATLAILFTVLRLAGYIGWPWLWVTCPAWIPVSFLFVLYVCSRGVRSVMRLLE